VVMALGLQDSAPGPRAPGVVFLREGDGGQAFALLADALRAESVAPVLARLGTGPLVAADATRARLDLARIDALRDACPR